MKRNVLRGLLIAGVFLSAAVLTASLLLLFNTQWRKTEVVSFSSGSSGYTLTVYEIGEPDFPFGSTHCSAVLQKSDKTVRSVRFDILHDGAHASADLFSVRWDPDSACLTAQGDEQEDMLYFLQY